MSKPSAGSSKCVVTPSPAEGDPASWERRIGRQRRRRSGIDELWGQLDDLVNDARPKVSRQGFHRSQALKSGRTRSELLEATLAQTRRLVAPGAVGQACTTQAVAPGALEQAYTLQSGAGLIAIELKSGKIAHQSLSFQDLTSWIPVEARGNIQASLDALDGDDFNSFCQLVVRDTGEPRGETFLGRDAVVGRSITVRFFTRAPGPSDLRNPEWLLMVRPVTLTLVGVQPRQLELPAAGTRRPFWGQERIPEAVGVFTADLSGGTPSQWTVQAAHVRCLLDCELASGTYGMEVGNLKPLEMLTAMFTFEVSKEEGGGASWFSRASATLEGAASSALSIAQRSASWLTRSALETSLEWLFCLDDDDAVRVSIKVMFKLFGGLSTSVSVHNTIGRAAYHHGGLGVMFFVADPAQPLDGNLRATTLRLASISSYKPGGSTSSYSGVFDAHRPFVLSCVWGGGAFRVLCKRIGMDLVSKKKAAIVEKVEDVSQLVEKLKVSPGVGVFRDGCATICVGQTEVQPASTAGTGVPRS